MAEEKGRFFPQFPLRLRVLCVLCVEVKTRGAKGCLRVETLSGIVKLIPKLVLKSDSAGIIAEPFLV